MIVDFTNVPAGTEMVLENVGPDEPFGGGEPGVDFEPADPSTTGQVMRFHVVARDPARPQHAAESARAPGDRSARRRDGHAAGLAERDGVGHGIREGDERRHRPRLCER